MTIQGSIPEPKHSDLNLEDCLLHNRNNDISGINYDRIAEFVTQRASIIHIIENRKTYLYSNGVYCGHAHDLIESVLYELFSEFTDGGGQSILKKRDLSEIRARIDAKCGISIEQLETVAGNVFNAANGILDLDTGQLNPPSPDNLTLTKSPTAYDPEAECPNFLEFLDEALDTSAQKDAIGEMVGYILESDYHVHKAFMLLGPKRAGKGTFIRTIEATIGHDDCSHVSLQDLSDHRFARARLFGKKLNTSGDLPAIPIKDPGIFKNLTGEDTIDAENKFEQIFSFKNRAKLLFSANALPKLRYEDDAFYNRWIIIPFNNSMFGKEDPGLTARLTTPEERSGILNFGLEGLKRLRTNGWHFSYGEKESGELYRRASNPVIAFLEDKCEPSEGYVVKADLLKAYNEYAKAQGLPPATSKKSFGTALQDQAVIPVDTTNPKVNGKQVEAWSGIRLKENQ